MTTLEDFNGLPEAEARDFLARCLDVPRWIDTVLDGRPYADRAALLTVAEVAASSMTPEELASALSRHPRIGERPGAGHDAAHSRREQAGIEASDADLAARLDAGNRRYEERFARVFLIRAKGRDAQEVLAELERRLEHDDATEHEETVTQLREIALLRLEEGLS